MNDKELLLKTIENDIKNIDKCIDMCIDDDGIDYLKSIQKDLRKQEIEILKRISIDKMLKEKQYEEPKHSSTLPRHYPTNRLN